MSVQDGAVVKNTLGHDVDLTDFNMHAEIGSGSTTIAYIRRQGKTEHSVAQLLCSKLNSNGSRAAAAASSDRQPHRGLQALVQKVTLPSGSAQTVAHRRRSCCRLQ